jgi:hypothetical protein
MTTNISTAPFDVVEVDRRPLFACGLTVSSFVMENGLEHDFVVEMKIKKKTPLVVSSQ